MAQKDIVIIGGGLAGLISAYLLGKAGREVWVLEKKNYPFHRVCGEYVSNEVKQFLVNEDLFPHSLVPATLTQFRLSSLSGKIAEIPLDQGGFGISRYAFDHFLYQKCKEVGVRFKLQTQALDIKINKMPLNFSVFLDNGEIWHAGLVLGAFGKRSRIDKAMERPFIAERTPYIGVKYHARLNYDSDTIGLYNFEGGYCGINAVEDGIFNICYLGERATLRKWGNIPTMEKEVLFKNPKLRDIFENSEFLFEKPEVINEISFSDKNPVENHVLMLGDAAGMITPLCGNGMAIAIHTGKLATDAILTYSNHLEIEQAYSKAWKSTFQQRLTIGRNVQKLFGTSFASDFAVSLVNYLPFLARQIIKQTHGKAV
ncbi:NAD(P)/FAD-dependent oxidoreductase [Pleomorphovibrio marinus]|uniref:NAD(P)/FAD-dependent oxidoreductase n=1 Tax=Pleomorphovibrio marinus TaxID=2164132 RepID=UPI000E0B81A9|nr:NAD(P)/FAD-dependent oxidoreductase [Pleomorphovibrio marinus]